MIIYKRIEMDSRFYHGERELRNKVLLEPIGIPDFGWEMYDSESYHFVALSGEIVVGCVLLRPLPNCSNEAQLMQMAIHPQSQKQGIGSGLINKLISFSLSKGLNRITCHSRENAVGFYEKLGFAPYGQPFTEVEILHRHMFLNIDMN